MCEQSAKDVVLCLYVSLWRTGSEKCWPASPSSKGNMIVILRGGIMYWRMHTFTYAHHFIMWDYMCYIWMLQNPYLYLWNYFLKLTHVMQMHVCFSMLNLTKYTQMTLFHTRTVLWGWWKRREWVWCWCFLSPWEWSEGRVTVAFVSTCVFVAVCFWVLVSACVWAPVDRTNLRLVKRLWLFTQQ